MTKILFYSSNATWGGSEVLWYKAAEKLRESFGVSFIADYASRKEEHVKRLPEKGIRVQFYNRHKKTLVVNRFVSAKAEIRSYLKKEKPSLVVITLGSHFLIGNLPSICLSEGIPYIFIFQLVDENKWVETEKAWHEYKAALHGAAACYFVSDSNQQTIEKMIASRLTNGKRIQNPFQVNFDLPFSFPPINDHYQLANVARYSISHKGQDVLLEVLAQEKWKTRNLRVSLIGDGSCRTLLNELIKYYGIKNVTVPGPTRDIGQVWATHHGLFLPSRREGSSLALMEALVMGRVPVCTAAGSVPELLRDNDNGFVAKYCHAEFVDDALERAWSARNTWAEIGKKNYELARTLFVRDPVEVLCDEIQNLLKDAAR